MVEWIRNNYTTRNLQAVFFIKCNSLPIFLTVFSSSSSFSLTLTIILFHRKGYEGTLSWFPDASYVYYARLYLFYDRQILMHARANTVHVTQVQTIPSAITYKSMHARNASLAQFNRARFQRRMKLLLLFRSFFRPPPGELRPTYIPIDRSTENYVVLCPARWLVVLVLTVEQKTLYINKQQPL